MDTFLANHAYLALFLLSFLAATLLPLGSEWLLATLVVKGYEPVMLVGIATAGNTLGALTTYAVGWTGANVLVERVLRISADQRRRAEQRYARYGSWSLLLSWVPIIGDPLCLVGGLLKVRVSRFVVLVLVGKLGRYVAVAWLAWQAATGA